MNLEIDFMAAKAILAIPERFAAQVEGLAGVRGAFVSGG